MSIKRQLLTLIIATVVLASFFAALQGYRNSVKQLDTVFDQELVTVAQFIASVAGKNEVFPEQIEGELAYQLFRNDILISRSENTPKDTIVSAQQGFSEASFSGQRWRTYSLLQGAYKIVVAHRIEARISSAESILYVTIAPIVISIPFIAFLIYYIIHKSLKALLVLSSQLKSKSTDDLTEVTVENPPEELEPVITRLNNLLRRLDTAFEREKQLTANAAHELRTPVSVLSLTTHNMTKDFEKSSLTSESFVELQQNVDRMAHVIEQMIALFRFTHEQFKDKECENDIEAILQQVISSNYDDIERNHQQVSLDASQQWVMGEQFALYTLFENILRNAIKYSGVAAEIKVSVSVFEEIVSVAIEDSGKGLDDAELTKIFERFYRVNQTATRVKGSGLGLSIVKHIAQLHDAEIHCEKSSLGGLKVQVDFPQCLAPSKINPKAITSASDYKS